MEFLLDSTNLEDIKELVDYLPISGITSNPSIIKKDSPKDFLEHMRKLREIIGDEMPLHIQVTETGFDGILKEAEAINEKVSGNVYIKVPADFVGIKAIRALKEKGYKVTATAIYDTMQAFLALEAGADTIAPYYNRILNLGGDPDELIEDLITQIIEGGYNCQIIGASFKSLGQVKSAIMSGAQCVTVQPEILKQVFKNPSINEAVENFRKDWYSLYKENLVDL